MNKLDIFKSVTEIVVSVGVGSIVGQAIKLTTTPEVGRIKKVCVGIGGYVLSSMVSDMAGKYATNRIDETASRISAIVKGAETASEVIPPVA